ncbi:ATP-binding protein [Streptomyces mesophilus]|uniref:ATP-binding protein n=1 Tax=Streptomyces mesophilus TaxID=1775132 RepID=UPI002E2C6950|nr:ATP-binding protein [Streptomyces mesophilus]
MRVPIRHIAGHLVWSTHGTVWAVYRLHPDPDETGEGEEMVQGTYVPAAVREQLLGRVTHLVRSLSGAPRLFGLCAQVDPGEVAMAMVDGVDPDAAQLTPDGVHPWVESVEAALSVLEYQEMHRRTLWLAVPLKAEGRGLNVSAAAGAVWAELSTSLGMRAKPVHRDEVASYQEQAAQVEAQLSGAIPLRPARPAEVVWMVQHAIHRGLAEPLLADAEASGLYGGQVRGGTLRSPSYAELGQVRIAEGGTGPTSDEDLEVVDRRKSARGRAKQGAKSSPLVRRWLEVETQQGTGFQAHLALAECPPAVAADSADLFAQLEVLEYPVDYVIDLTLVEAEKAKAQVQRKRTELVDQADQYDARPTGMPSSLLQAAKDLGELDARLSRTSVEVEVQSVTSLTVWGPTVELCDARARSLAALLGKLDYRAVRPTGLQEALFTLALPATVRPQAVKEFTQHQLSEDWAMGGAFTTIEIGDPNGQLIGFDLDCGTARPVMINLANAPRSDASASFGIVADPGGGKSVMEKLLTIGVVDRGERAICIDRTPLKEWATFARSAATGRCQIIDVVDAELSIDPLRIFAGHPQASHYALSYLTLQMVIGPMSSQGGVLHRAVEMAAASAQPSMRLVLDAVEQIAGQGGSLGDTAASLRTMLDIVAHNPLAAMIFDPALPVVRLDQHMTSDLIVFTTTGLTLPPKEAFGNIEVLHQQPLEALIGRAVLYLIAAISRQVAFSDANRFCALAADELWWLTNSAEGSALVSEFLHDGRKHGAGLIAAAQDEEELGPDRGLMAYRALGRITDKKRARRALEFIGLDPDNKELVELVTTKLSPVRRGPNGTPLKNNPRAGEVLLTGPRMNTGRIKVAIPPVTRIADSIKTTPEETTATRSPRHAAPGAAHRPAGTRLEKEGAR